MMTSFVSDWITRVTFIMIGGYATFALLHGVRDSYQKKMLGAILIICLLILGHLPRIPGIVVTEGRPTIQIDPIRTDPIWVGNNLFANMDQRRR